MKKFAEKTIRSKRIYEGKIVDLYLADVELPNGKTAKREWIKHPGAVGIIPITKDKKIVFVEQYRKALEKSLIEIPAGKLEKGEAPEKTAIRELEEETGYTSSNLSFITSFYTSPGFANEMMHIYMTNELEKLQTPAPKDEDEFVELVELTLAEAVNYVKTGKIQDAKTNYAILYLQMLEMMP